MMRQSSGGWRGSGSGATGKKERWVSCLPDHSLAVAGHRPDVGAPHWSIEASINRSVVSGHL